MFFSQVRGDWGGGLKRLINCLFLFLETVPLHQHRRAGVAAPLRQGDHHQLEGGPDCQSLSEERQESEEIFLLLL